MQKHVLNSFQQPFMVMPAPHGSLQSCNTCVHAAAGVHQKRTTSFARQRSFECLHSARKNICCPFHSRVFKHFHSLQCP